MTPRTIACIGTGPSLTADQISVARRKGFTLYGCNLVYQMIPDLAVLFATNAPFWDHYWPRTDGPRSHPCEKWTNCQESADRYGLRYIRSRDRQGLSRDPERLHHGHSSGFCLLNLAYLHGAERIVLLGYDMKYAPDYEPRNRQPGATPRHYFGEYPSSMQHWPSLQVKAGVHVELVRRYEAVAAQGLIEIINCTPDSALSCFPRQHIEDV